MARFARQARLVPRGGAPATIVEMGKHRSEREPAPLHFSKTTAAIFAQLVRKARQVHVFGDVSMHVEYAKWTATFRK